MNHRMLTVCALGVATTCLALLTGCSSAERDGYRVSGKVTARHIDYDCKSVQGRALSQAVTRPSGGTSSSGGSSGRAGTGSGSRGASGRTSGSASGGGNGPSIAKPRKIMPGDIPRAPGARPRNTSHCRTEYELFIENSEGTFQQTVTADHYRRCGKGEKFSACTTSGS